MKPLFAALLLAGGFALPAAVASAEDPPAQTVTVTVEVEKTCGARFRPCAVEWQRMRRLAYVRLKRVRSLSRALRYDGQVSEAINLACTAYRVSCQTLWRKARCETGGTFSPRSANRTSSARGLFQFLTTPRGGTWATTPYRYFSVFSPYANSLAAGWMHQVGRGGEWSCK